MTDRSKLLALAEAVEKLTGPDREVDMAIQLETGNVPEHYERAVSHGKPLLWFWHKTNSRAPFVTPKFYTDSLDVAMTLVPDTCTVNLMMGKDRPNAVQVHHFLPGALIPHKQSVASSITPALALTAACLRAQAEALS